MPSGENIINNNNKTINNDNGSQNKDEGLHNNENITETEIEITFHDDELDEKNSTDDGNKYFSNDILVDDEINDIVNADEEDYEFRHKTSHRWDNGILLFEIEMESGLKFEVPFSMLKKDRSIEHNI